MAVVLQKVYLILILTNNATTFQNMSFKKFNKHFSKYNKVKRYKAIQKYIQEEYCIMKLKQQLINVIISRGYYHTNKFLDKHKQFKI